MEIFRLDKPLNKATLPYSEIEFFENDIMRFTFNKNIFVTMSMAMDMTHLAKQLCPDRRYRSLKILHFKMQLEDEVTKYLSGNGRQDMVKAEAFVITNTTLRFFANFYMKVKRPLILSKIFNNEEDAIKWLLSCH